MTNSQNSIYVDDYPILASLNYDKRVKRVCSRKDAYRLYRFRRDYWMAYDLKEPEYKLVGSLVKQFGSFE